MFWALFAILIVTYLVVDRLLRLPKIGNYGNKFVFITGCDSGFGRELAIRLDQLGFHVFAGCLTQDGITSIRETCSSHVTALHLNVAKVDSIEAAFDEIKKRLPDDKSLWAVVNNAGVSGPVVPPEMCTKHDYLEVCDVNLFGPIEVSRIFMPLLRKSQGRLVNMTSMAGRVAAPFAPYSVSKYGLEGFSDVIRRHMHQFGVKVSIIEPGAFKTPILTLQRFMDAATESYNRSSPEVKVAYGSDYLDKEKALLTGAIRNASNDKHEVVEAYVSAITSKFPRDRYVVGNDARYFSFPLTFMPAWVADQLYRVLEYIIMWKAERNSR